VFATPTPRAKKSEIAENGLWEDPLPRTKLSISAMNQGSSSSNSSSSSSHSPNGKSAARGNANKRVRVIDEADEIDLFGTETRNGNGDIDDDGDDVILGDDPLHEDLNEPLSFKRKQKQTFLSHPGRLLTALTGNRSPIASPGRSPQPLSRLEPVGAENRYGNHHESGTKDGLPLDWYVEGPGRRVGYEDLTAIDWIFEYTKERQRLRVLYSSATGLLGIVQQFLDASQVWIILVLCGLAVGALAAGIDVTTDWLGDLKYGYCATDDGGAFYLSKGFCCLGYDEHAKCLGWRPWGAALGLTSTSGKWIVGYFFFLLLAVCDKMTCNIGFLSC
jgi:chloride channel 3/4/5